LSETCPDRGPNERHGSSPGHIYYEEGQGRAGTRYFLDVYLTAEGLGGRVFAIELEQAIRAAGFCVLRGSESAVRDIPVENRCLDRWGGSLHRLTGVQ
jgi:hypothetical protein